jgi:hypothetical protein
MNYGIPEIVIIIIVGLLSIGLPVVVIGLLAMIYIKVKSVEELLKRDK